MVLFRGGLRGLAGLIGRGLGIALRYREHRRWLRVIGGATTREVLRRYPRLAFRHSTPYLFAGASWSERLRMLVAHYGFLNSVHDDAFYGEVLSPRGFPLWRAEPSLAVTLHGPDLQSRHREGELSLRFAVDGACVYTLAFSIVDAWRQPGFGLFVGQVQGAAGHRDLLREAAQSCCGVHPRDMLMSALEGLAEGWSVVEISGVSDACQLSKQGPAPRMFGYDAFWGQYQGVREGESRFRLPLPFHAGELRSQSPAHRRRTRLKRTFLAQLREVARASVAAEVRRKPCLGRADPANRRASDGTAHRLYHSPARRCAD